MRQNGPGVGVIAAAGILILWILTKVLAAGMAGLAAAVSGLLKLALFGMGAMLLLVIAILIVVFKSKGKKEQEKEIVAGGKEVGTDQLKSVLQNYVTDGTLGDIASAAIQQKRQLDDALIKYEAVAAQRFGKETMTYTKYMSVAASSKDALQDAFRTIVTRMQSFDSREYRLLSSGLYKTDAVPDAIQEEKLETYKKHIAEMQDTLSDTERVIVQLNDLTLKLQDVDSRDSSSESVEEEVKELTEQLKFYEAKMRG